MTPSFSSDIPTWVPASAAIWLLASVWLGWKRGFVRQATSLAGLGLAVAAGFWIGPLIAPVVPAMGFASFMKPILGGCMIGFLAWGAVSIFSSIIFRKTEDQEFGLIRLLYGLSGAALGLLSGILVLIFGAWGVRFFGSFAEGLQKGTRVANQKIKPHAVPEPEPLVSLKKAIEESGAGSLMAWLDPLPQSLYPRLQKIGQVFANPAARDKFLTDPGMEVLSKNAKLLALKLDPELQQSLQSGDVWSVLRNPKVQVAASDALLLTTLRTIDLDKILDRALSTPVSGGVPATGPLEKTPPTRAGAMHSKP